MERHKMPLSQRAKQFLPFAALAGYEEALRAKERQMGYTDRPEFTDDAAEEINAELTNLIAGDICFIKYYNRGEVDMVKGSVTKVDTVFRRIYMGEKCIRMDDILGVKRL